MGWREALERQLWAGCDGKRVEVFSSLVAMPAPDRIALARELLAGTGTGKCVATEVDECTVGDVLAVAADDVHASFKRGFRAGWNACRAAMMAADGR